MGRLRWVEYSARILEDCTAFIVDWEEREQLAERDVGG